MKVVILAGGYGTRISEYTQKIPKPMIPIAGKPIIWHIMNSYAKFGHNDFCIALGYKAEVIKEYFYNYAILNSDFSVSLNTGDIQTLKSNKLDWNVTMIDTGLDTMTGGRLKKLKNYIGNETFMLTYGDGLSDININELLDFHYHHGKMITLSAVRPAARFGELRFNGDHVSEFEEKPQLHEGWINGGFFVIEPKFIELIDDDSQMLERAPIQKALALGELMAYKHSGFWHCMDSKRDHEKLELIAEKSAPWL